MRRVEARALLGALTWIVGCSAAPPAEEPMGVLPSATTSAEPLWLPFAPIAGTSIEADPRETHLGQPRRLTDEGRYRSPAFAPDGRAVVAVREDEAGCGALVVIDLVGEARTLDAGGCASHPAYLGPETIVFTRGKGCDEAGAGCTLVALGPDGLRELASPSAWPAPSGQQVLFVRAEGSIAELWRVGEGDGTRLGALGAGSGGLSVAPGGVGLAWHGRLAGENAEGRTALYVAGAEGQTARAVPSRGPRALEPAHLSAKKLLFASDLDAPVGRPEALELYAVEPDGPARADGTAPTERVTFHSGYDGEPAVSADGEWVAFVSDRAGSRGLILARWVP